MTREEGTESARRVADILLAIAESGQPVGVNDLARRVGVGPATVHRVLRALMSRGLVGQDEKQRYLLGTAALLLGNQTTLASRLAESAGPSLDRLVELTGLTATVSALAGTRRVYVDQRLSSSELRYSVELGRPYSLQLGSSGRAILAHLPADVIASVLASPMPAEHGPAATIDHGELERRLEDVRVSGVAVSRNERIAGAGGMAAPVFTGHGVVIGAVNVMGSASQLDDDAVPGIRDALLRESQATTGRLTRAHAPQRN